MSSSSDSPASSTHDMTLPSVTTVPAYVAMTRLPITAPSSPVLS